MIDGDLVIVQAITSNWGVRDRAETVTMLLTRKWWAGLEFHTGIQPVDSSFATPIFDWQGEKRVFYSGTGDGNIVCVNARTGEPIWRYHISSGGINSSCLIHEGKVIALHGNENVDSSDTGRMVAVKLGAEPGAGEEAPRYWIGPWRSGAIPSYPCSAVLPYWWAMIFSSGKYRRVVLRGCQHRRNPLEKRVGDGSASCLAIIRVMEAVYPHAERQVFYPEAGQ